jgi:hypothetical protein
MTKAFNTIENKKGGKFSSRLFLKPTPEISPSNPDYA